jgi:hypothetical protein
VVSTITLEKSAGFAAPVRVATARLSWISAGRRSSPIRWRQRRAVEGQLMLEEFLAAEQLVIGILNPARAQILVGEIVHVLEDRKPRHQPRRQRRVSSLVGIDRPEPILEEAPVDRPAKLGQRVVHVDDLIEPRPEEIVLPAVPPLPGPHRITLRQADGETESRPNAPINLQEITPIDAAFLQTP